jgi:hypothetical protein
VRRQSLLLRDSASEREINDWTPSLTSRFERVRA